MSELGIGRREDKQGFAEGFAYYLAKECSPRALRNVATVFENANRFQTGQETAREVLSTTRKGKAVIKLFELYSKQGPSLNLDAFGSAKIIQNMSEEILFYLRER